MTKDDIIKLAREAGWSGLYTTYNAPTGKADWKMVNESLIVPVTMEQIERFAALVAAHKAEVALAEAYRCGYEAGVVAERAECAKLCESEWSNVAEKMYGQEIAAAIRARGTT